MRTWVDGVTMLDMTDPNTAQATVLIAALQDQLSEMVAKLARTENEASIGRPERTRAIRLDAAQLRRDVQQARFLIAQMQRRFPEAEITEPTPVADVE